MGKNRRGKCGKNQSSKQATIPFKKEAAASTKFTVTKEKQRNTLDKLTARLRSGVDDKGKPLTDEKITKTLTTISNLEVKLGITHTD